jgi:hypothetical protein
MLDMLGLFLMIGVISGALIGYAVVLGRREDRGDGLSVAPKVRDRVAPAHLDPDAHLGHCGTE